ncbi:alpha/beta hydrolase [Maricaulaceae bacterium MS644]
MVFTAMILAAALQGAAPDPQIEAVQAVAVERAIEPAAPSPAALNMDTDLRPLACPFIGRVEYEPGELSCGTIVVPENREAAVSRSIRLMYVHMPATGEDEDRRDDPVIYLTGGPGVPVEGYVERLRDHPLFETRDLYILEQRGIANSGEFCPQYDVLSPGLADPRTFEETEIANAERMGLCFSEASARGVDLRGYNTQENARDIKALREALEFEQWNVWGISYGSHLGQMVMHEDPAGVRAIVLDAIVPNDLGGGFGDTGRMAETILETYSDACTPGAPCDGFVDRMFSAIESMQENPVIVMVDNPEIAPSGELWIPPIVLMAPAFVMSYEHEQHPAAPAVTDRLSQLFTDPDPAFLEGLGAALSNGGAPAPFGAVAAGMSATVRCNDGYMAQTLADQQASTHTRFEGVFYTDAGARASLDMCERFGLIRRTGPAYAIPEASVPTLIVNGDADPVTPPWLAEYIHARMPGSRLVITPNAGHGPTRAMPECAGEVLTAFFDAPDVDALDASCLEEGVDAPVYPRVMSIDAPLKLLALAPGAPQSFILPGAWVGLPLLVLLLTAVLTPFGFVARVIDRNPASEMGADTGGARLAAWLTALAALGGVGLLAAGGYAAYEIAPLALIAGLLGPAWTGAWMLLAAGALGAVTLVLLVRALGAGQVRIGTLTGFALTGAAGIAVAAFALVFGITPF